MKIEHNLNLNSIEYVILKLNKRKEKFQHKIWDNNNNNNSINKKNCRVFWLIFIIINFQRISTMANVFFFFVVIEDQIDWEADEKTLIWHIQISKAILLIFFFFLYFCASSPKGIPSILFNQCGMEMKYSSFVNFSYVNCECLKN